MQLVHVVIEVVLWGLLGHASRGNLARINLAVNWVSIHVISGQNRFHSVWDLGVHVLSLAFDHVDLGLLLLVSRDVRLVQDIDAGGPLGRTRLVRILGPVVQALPSPALVEQVVGHEATQDHVAVLLEMLSLFVVQYAGHSVGHSWPRR